MTELVTDLQLLIKEIQELSYDVVGWFDDETTPENLILVIFYVQNLHKNVFRMHFDT